jgi:hypothetical protein
MWAAQAQGLGRFQANDQSAHVPLRRLHARQVGVRHTAVSARTLRDSSIKAMRFPVKTAWSFL